MAEGGVTKADIGEMRNAVVARIAMRSTIVFILKIILILGGVNLIDS